MVETRDPLQKAEEVASSQGGPKTDRASAMRSQSHAEGKMENELEMQKANRQHVTSADQVAGRKSKGTMTGLLEKLTGDPRKGDPNK